MRRAAWILPVFFIVVAAGLFTSCKPKAPKVAPEARPAPQPTVSAPAPAPTPSPSVREGVLSEDLATLNRRGYLKDAFFDYDKSNLREDARSALSGDADWLKRYSSIQILIEGHCDERGTSEYNMALGDRRANASLEYLVSLGVDASRIKTISYGKERPFCTESNETCWQENRRGHLVITAK